MPGKRISELTALSGAGSANNDDVLIFDTNAAETKRISRSQLAEGMTPDLPLQYYLGVLNSNPTQRLNGDALMLGDYYLDAVTKYTTIYNGSGWNSYASVIAVQTASEAARDAAIVAKDAAQLAETNAETAETNAELAETNAETARAAALVAQAAAELAEVNAETARDAAFVNANVYANTTDGLAAVALGGQFQVVAGSEVIRYREDAGPVATEVARYPAMATVTTLQNDVRGIRYGLSDFDYSTDVPDQFRVAQSVLEGSANVRLSTTADAGGNKINADGTITVGAGSYVEYPNIGNVAGYDPNGYYYLYLVPVDPARAADLSVEFRQNDAATASAENTVDRSQYGVVKITYRNRNISGGAAFAGFFPRIKNNGATALDMVWPSSTQVDDARIPQRMLASLGVPNRQYEQEIRSFEFWEQPGFFELDMTGYLRSTTAAIDSVLGNDANAGTRFAPKQTLSSVGAAGSLTNGAIVALRRGSVWREQLQAYFGATVWDAAFVADDRGKKGNMPLISSFRPISDGDITDNGNGTFTFTFQPNASSQPVLNATMNNGYNTVIIRERNTALNAAGNILAAGYVLRRVTSLGDVALGPGRTFASYNSGTNTWTMTFSPRTGVTPKDGTNTYEVIAQSGCILQASGSTSDRNATFVGLHVDGAGAGYGMISGGVGSLIDFCALTDGDTHHAVLASMTIQRSLISSNGNTLDSIAVSYSIGDNTRDTVTVYDRNFIFAKGGAYGHNNSDETKRAKALVVTQQYLVGERDPVTNAARGGLGGADQTDSTIRRFNYARNILGEADSFANTFRPSVVSEYNFIDGVVRVQATAGGMRENIFIGQNYGDQTVAAPANRGVMGVYASPNGVFENNLYVMTHEDGNFVPSSVTNYKADYSGALVHSTILGNGIVATAQSRVRKNIFVVHMPYAVQESANVTFFVANNASIFGNLDLDENIYVLLDCGLAPSITGPGQDLTAPPTLVPPANTGGTANALTLTTGQSLVANPGTIVFTATAANTGAVTVNVDGIGTAALKNSSGVDLTAGQIAINTRYAARLMSGEYHLLTFQSHIPGMNFIRQKTGYERNGLIIDARGHPLGLNAVFRDFARRDLRLANTDVADQIRRFNAERMKDGLAPCGPSWTINRNVRQLTRDDAYRVINRRALLA